VINRKLKIGMTSLYGLYTLRKLLEDGGCFVTELITEVPMSKAALYQFLYRFQRNGWIETKMFDTNSYGRQCFYLTEKGQQEVKKILQPLQLGHVSTRKQSSEDRW